MSNFKDKKTGQEFVDWTTLVSRAGLKKAPHLLKMDIEGFEWGVLPS